MDQLFKSVGAESGYCPDGHRKHNRTQKLRSLKFFYRC